MRYVGVDGCRGGWFAVMMGDDGSWKTALLPGLEEVVTVSPGASHILVDIPIGLPASKPRRCDREARMLLGPGRGSSVFPVPCRKAVHAHDYDEACKLNRKHLGTGISRQTWSICRKIAHADDLLRDRRDFVGIIRESHPEVCLWALAGKKSMHYSKKTRQGRLERMTILETVFPDAVQVYEHALVNFPRADVARDDIIDALALVVSTGSCRGDVEAIPGAPEYDDEGLPMEIVLPKRLNTHCPVR